MRLISNSEARLKYCKWLWSSFSPKTASWKEKKKHKKEKEKKPATLKKKNLYKNIPIGIQWLKPNLDSLNQKLTWNCGEHKTDIKHPWI